MRKLIFALILLLALPASGEEMWVKAYPKISLAQISDGATVRITVHIPKNKDNRYRIVIWADSFSELGRSEKTMDGENEVATYQFYLEHLGDGHYVVTLVVFDKNNKEHRATDTFQVGGDAQ